MIASDSTPHLRQPLPLSHPENAMPMAPPPCPPEQALISINAHFMTARVYGHVGFIYFSLHYAECGPPGFRLCAPPPAPPTRSSQERVPGGVRVMNKNCRNAATCNPTISEKHTQNTGIEALKQKLKSNSENAPMGHGARGVPSAGAGQK